MFDVYIRDFQRGTDIVEKEELIQSIPSLSEGALRFVSSNVSCEMGNAESASFTIESGTPYYDAFLQMKTYIRIEYDGDIIFNGRVLTINNTFYGTRSITCEGPLAFLNDTAMEGTKESARKKRDAKTHMLEVLSNHNKMVKDPKRRIYLGEVPGKYSDDIGDNQKVATTEQKFGEDKWSESKSILEDLRSHFGGFYRIRYSLTKPTKAEGAVLKDGSESEYDMTPSIPTAYKTEGGQEVPTAGWYMYLDWFNHYFNKDTNTQTVEVGKNVIDISSSTEVSNIFTVVIPVSTKAVSSQDGKGSGSTENVYIDGKELPVPKICEKYSDNKLNRGYHSKEDYLQAINRYGRIIKTVSFDDADTKEKLYDKACEWILNNYQGEVTKFSVKAVDLHQIGENTNKICVGDRVNIKYIVGSENGTTNKVTIKRTCLSVTYDLLNPENNSYTFGIPANVLTKTYGIKRTNNQNNTPSKPGGDNDEPDPEETDWWYKLRDWLMNHMVWYSTGHPTAPLPYSDDDIHNAFMWGPNSPSVSSRSYLDYIYTTEDVAGLFNYLLWIPTKVGEQWDSCQDSEGHTHDALWHEKQYNALYYNGPNGEPTNAGMYAAKQFKAHHSRGTWSVGTRPVSLGGPLTLNAVLNNHIIEYVRDEYQFDLKYMSGIRMPSNVTLPSGAQITTQVIVDQQGNEHVVDHSLYDPESGAQVFMRSDGVNIALLIDENGNYHYYFEDADGNPQEVSIKGLYSDLEAAGIKIETMEGQINIIGTEILPDLHNIHTELSQHGATITSITSDITTIGQRFSGEIANLLVQIAKMNQELADLDRTVTLISTDINIIGQRMDQSLADLIVQVSGLKSRLDGHDITITTITTDITVIGQKMDASYSGLIERMAVMGRTITAITTDITLIGQRMDASYSDLISQIAQQGHTITAITTDVTLIGQRMDKNVSRLVSQLADHEHTITAITTDVTIIGQRMDGQMASTIARLADMNRTVTAITSDIVLIGQKMNKNTSDFLARLAKHDVDITAINTAINLFNADQLTPEIQQQIEDCAAHGLTVTAFGSDLVLFKGKLDAQNARIRRIESDYIKTNQLSAEISKLSRVYIGKTGEFETGAVLRGTVDASGSLMNVANTRLNISGGLQNSISFSNVLVSAEIDSTTNELVLKSLGGNETRFKKAGSEELDAPSWTGALTDEYHIRTILGKTSHNVLDKLVLRLAGGASATVSTDNDKHLLVPVYIREISNYTPQLDPEDEQFVARASKSIDVDASQIYTNGQDQGKLDGWDLARTKLGNPTTQNYNSATMYVGIPAADYDGSSSYAYSAAVVKNGVHSYATIKNGIGTVIAAKQIEYEIGDLSAYADKDASVTKSGVTYTNSTHVGSQGYYFNKDEETGEITVAIVITGSVQVNGETKAFVADHYDYLETVPTAIYNAGVHDCEVKGVWRQPYDGAPYSNLYVVQKNGADTSNTVQLITEYSVHNNGDKYVISAKANGYVRFNGTTGTEVYDNGKTDGWTGCYNTVTYETSTTSVSANVVTIDPGGQICVKVLANSTKDATEATAKTSLLVQANQANVTVSYPAFIMSGQNAGPTNTITAHADSNGSVVETKTVYTALILGEAFSSANPSKATVYLKTNQTSLTSEEWKTNGTIVGRLGVTAPEVSVTWAKPASTSSYANIITVKQGSNNIDSYTISTVYTANTTNYIVQAVTSEGTVRYQTTTDNTVYTNGQNSMGISVPVWSKSSGATNNDTFTLSVSSGSSDKSKAFVVAAVPEITYNSTTHKYTAKAIGTINGYRQGDWFTIPSGTEAYVDGQNSIKDNTHVQFTQVTGGDYVIMAYTGTASSPTSIETKTYKLGFSAAAANYARTTTVQVQNGSGTAYSSTSSLSLAGYWDTAQAAGYNSAHVAGSWGNTSTTTNVWTVSKTNDSTKGNAVSLTVTAGADITWNTNNKTYVATGKALGDNVQKHSTTKASGALSLSFSNLQGAGASGYRLAYLKEGTTIRLTSGNITDYGDGYTAGRASVNTKTQEKTITKNVGENTYTPASGYIGFSKVVVNNPYTVSTTSASDTSLRPTVSYTTKNNDKYTSGSTTYENKIVIDTNYGYYRSGDSPTRTANVGIVIRSSVALSVDGYRRTVGDADHPLKNYISKIPTAIWLNAWDYGRSDGWAACRNKVTIPTDAIGDTVVNVQSITVKAPTTAYNSSASSYTYTMNLEKVTISGAELYCVTLKHSNKVVARYDVNSIVKARYNAGYDAVTSSGPTWDPSTYIGSTDYSTTRSTVTGTITVSSKTNGTSRSKSIALTLAVNVNKKVVYVTWKDGSTNRKILQLKYT